MKLIIKLSLSVVTVFALAVVVSIFLGTRAVSGCLWAIVASAVAGVGALVPVVWAMFFRPSMLSVTAIGSSIIRLLLVLICAVTILLFIGIDVLWFAAWLGIFYTITIIAEVFFLLRVVNERQNGVRNL